MHHGNSLLRLAVAAGALAVSGCVSLTAMQTADTLPQGKVQLGLEPSFEGLASGSGAAGLPCLNVAARFGVSDTFEVGGRAGSSGLEVQGKFLLSNPADRSLAVSLAPAVGGIPLGATQGGTFGRLSFSLPLLIGIEAGAGSQLVLGPRLMDAVVVGDGFASVLLAGASLGYAMRLPGGLRIMPELGLAIPLVGNLGGDSVDMKGEGVFFQFGIGLLFDL